jgi:hypothetical protein
VTFTYRGVAPVVQQGSEVVAYGTLLGHTTSGRLLFAEGRNGRFVNPLRRGGMGPFVERGRPRIGKIHAERDGATVPLRAVSDSVDLVAEVSDETPLAVPAPWYGLPVMPALVRWRLLGASGFETVVDGR